MTDKTKVVLAGWLSLSEDEQKEFDLEVQKYRKQSKIVQFNEAKSVRMHLGPVPGGCPCCLK